AAAPENNVSTNESRPLLADVSVACFVAVAPGVSLDPQQEDHDGRETSPLATARSLTPTCGRRPEQDGPFMPGPVLRSRNHRRACSPARLPLGRERRPASPGPDPIGRRPQQGRVDTWYTLAPENLPDSWVFPRRTQGPQDTVVVGDCYRRPPGTGT